MHLLIIFKKKKKIDRYSIQASDVSGVNYKFGQILVYTSPKSAVKFHLSEGKNIKKKEYNF